MSAIYRGKVYHSRTKCVSSPAEHAFSYPVWMALVDLQQVEQSPDTAPNSMICNFTDSSALALTRWRRSDHFGSNPCLSLDVQQLVKERVGLIVERIQVLTNLSFLSMYNFNPVSIFYCYSAEGNLVAAVLEVSNTPWLDKRMYVIDLDNSKATTWSKDFHVSPFMDGEHLYEWKIYPHTPDHKIRIDALSKRKPGALEAQLAPWQASHVNGQAPCAFAADSEGLPTTFVVSLALERVPDKEIAWTILSNPTMPLTAVLWIHIEAFRVWYKGVSYVTPPPGSRLLDLKDALVHLIVFIVAAAVRYGVILPVQLLRKMLAAVMMRTFK